MSLSQDSELILFYKNKEHLIEELSQSINHLNRVRGRMGSINHSGVN